MITILMTILGIFLYIASIPMALLFCYGMFNISPWCAFIPGVNTLMTIIVNVVLYKYLKEDEKTR